MRWCVNAESFVLCVKKGQHHAGEVLELAFSAVFQTRLLYKGVRLDMFFVCSSSVFTSGLFS